MNDAASHLEEFQAALQEALSVHLMAFALVPEARLEGMDEIVAVISETVRRFYPTRNLGVRLGPPLTATQRMQGLYQSIDVYEIQT